MSLSGVRAIIIKSKGTVASQTVRMPRCLTGGTKGETIRHFFKDFLLNKG